MLVLLPLTRYNLDREFFLLNAICIGKLGCVGIDQYHGGIRPGSGQTSTIKSEQRTIGSALGDKRFLRVPVYQRNFSWTKSEVTDLWEDLQGVLYGEEGN